MRLSVHKVTWLLSGPHASLHCHGPQEHLDISLPMAEVSCTRQSGSPVDRYNRNLLSPVPDLLHRKLWAETGFCFLTEDAIAF